MDIKNPQKKIISTPNAPQALGPYSQAVMMGGFIFLSGQIGINPLKNEMIPGGVSAETHQVLQNIDSILKAAGASFSHLIKTTIFLTRMEDFSTVNEIYAQYVKEPFPARSTIAVQNLPKGALIEIECIVHI